MKEARLPYLAYDMESLMRWAHPMASEMVTVLTRNSFVNALQEQQLQIYVMQAHPGDLQVALA